MSDAERSPGPDTADTTQAEAAKSRSRSPTPKSKSRSRSPKSRSRSKSPKSKSKSRSRSPPSRSRSRSPRSRSRSKSRSRSPRRRGGRDRDRDRGRYEEDFRKTTTCLFVGNLSHRFTDRDVEEEFSRYGRVEYVNLGWNRALNQPRGFAFVKFERREDAEAAFAELDGESFDGRRLRLDWDAGRENKVNGAGVG